MGSGSKILEVLPEYYGGVILTAAAGHIINMGLGMKVSAARKQYGIKYPIMYSSENGGENTFNCIQRAHQAPLETFPGFLVVLLFGGLQYPRISIGAGVTYLVGRLVFARGYSTGDTDKRKYGHFSMAGMLILLGNTVSFAAHQLKWV